MLYTALNASHIFKPLIPTPHLSAFQLNPPNSGSDSTAADTSISKAPALTPIVAPTHISHIPRELLIPAEIANRGWELPVVGRVPPTTHACPDRGTGESGGAVPVSPAGEDKGPG